MHVTITLEGDYGQKEHFDCDRSYLKLILIALPKKEKNNMCSVIPSAPQDPLQWRMLEI